MVENKCEFTHCPYGAEDERRIYRGDNIITIFVCKLHAKALDAGHPIALNYYGVTTGG